MAIKVNQPEVALNSETHHSSAKSMGSVIDPKRHERLLADIDHVLHRARIPRSMLMQSAIETCADPELEWLRNYRFHADKVQGFVLVGQPQAGKAGPELKMMAVCAALVRNFVDAQVMSLNSVLDSMGDGGEKPDSTVLLIPNLYIRQGGKTLPSWQMQKVYDLLLDRLTNSRLTCCYVESLEHLGADYGQNIANHLRDHYLTLAA